MVMVTYSRSCSKVMAEGGLLAYLDKHPESRFYEYFSVSLNEQKSTAGSADASDGNESEEDREAGVSGDHVSVSEDDDALTEGVVDRVSNP